MPNRFPGMDPYLEHPQLWVGAHSRLIVYLADQLSPTLRPRYVAAVEERVFVEGPDRRVAPDVWLRSTERPWRSDADDGEKGVAVVAPAAVAQDDEPFVVDVAAPLARETYIEILDLHSERRLVTVIELVSPTNKTPGPGRDSYLAKQQEVLHSHVHLVEIDLLRTGQHVLAVPEDVARMRQEYQYLVSVNRAERRSRFELYPRTLRQRLPRIRIPLAEGDADVRLDVQAEIDRLIELGRYEDRIDYSTACDPPLDEHDQASVGTRIAAHTA